MDFSLTDHQKLIRDTVRQFMETEVRPLVKDLEREEKFPLDLLKKLGEMGCCGMLTPEEWGGPGMDTVSYVLMLEEVARVYTAMSKTDPLAGGKGITAFLVKPSFKGFKIGRHEDKMGQRSSPSVEILLNDCEVPTENRLGEEGQGMKIALTALDNGRIGIAAQAIGLAQGALDESIKYAKQRRAFGKSISEFQAIQWMIADMQTELDAARGLTYYAAWLKDAAKSPSGGPATMAGGVPSGAASAASKAKLYASEMANRVVYKAVQIHGSIGYSRETDVERMYRDARVITIYEGTSEVQRMIIARDLLK